MAPAKGSFLQSNQAQLASPMPRMVGYPIAYSFSKLPPSNWASAFALHRSKGTRHAFYMTSIIHPSHPLRRRELALPTAASLAPRKPTPALLRAPREEGGEKRTAGRLRLVKNDWSFGLHFSKRGWLVVIRSVSSSEWVWSIMVSS